MALLLLFALFTKHLVCDFLWQPSWMLAGKGDFRSPGGYAHAGLHGLCTAVLLGGFGVAHWLWLGIFDAVVHYMVDRWKVRFGRSANLTPNLPQFWWAFGVDQYAHVLTYLAVVWLAGVLN